MTIVEAAPGITGGVDTYLDKHVAAALDPLGRLVGTESFDAELHPYLGPAIRRRERDLNEIG